MQILFWAFQTDLKLYPCSKEIYIRARKRGKTKHGICVNLMGYLEDNTLTSSPGPVTFKKRSLTWMEFEFWIPKQAYNSFQQLFGNCFELGVPQLYFSNISYPYFQRIYALLIQNLKVNGKQFDQEDISLTEAFAIFCGIGRKPIFVSDTVCY